MTIRVGVVMDPIEHINIATDATFAMLLELERRGWEYFYLRVNDLFLQEGMVFAQARKIKVHDNNKHWVDFLVTKTLPLHELDVILMRKDPPFNINYIYTTYLLEQVERQGVLVVNKPQSLRDANEKLFTSWFAECCPPTLVGSNMGLHREFLDKYQEIILKPLDSMQGTQVFYVRAGDPNLGVILETLTQFGKVPIMAQQFIPEVTQGDKRILMINGEPVPYVLARIPQGAEIRASDRVGGVSCGRELTAHDKWICERVGSTLRAKGLYFVGLDVIGDYLTEINVTSPACVRELDDIYNINISAQLMDFIATKLNYDTK